MESISEEWESFLTLCAVKTPMVYEDILRLLPCSDLLEMSLVSRFYRESSRSFLRLYKCLQIKVESPNCCRLAKLNNMLEHAIDLPFSGLYFSLHVGFVCKHDICPQHESLLKDAEILYPFIFQKLPVRNVTIYLFISRPCSTENVLQKLFTTRISSETKYLELKSGYCSDSFWEYFNIPKEDPNSTANSLNQRNSWKALEIIDTSRRHYRCKNFWWGMLMSAPLLKEIHSIMPAGVTTEIGQQPGDQPNEYPQIPREKVNVLKKLCVESAVDIRSLAHLRPLLHTLEISVDITGSEEMATLLATVMEGTKNVLQRLVCHGAYLLPCLINKHTGPLVKLHSLDIGWKPESFEDVWLLLATLDFSTLLPNLRKVRVTPWMIGPHAYQINNRAQLLKSAKFKCYTVTDLEMDYYENNINTLSFHSLMAEVFPAIRTFRSSAKYGNEALWKRVCTLWEHSLETVSLQGGFISSPYDGSVEPLVKTLENLICDISCEELQFVMETCPGGLQSWSYAATKRAVCLEFGITKFTSVYLLHFRERNGREFDKDRLDRIISWIRLKIPGFVFQYEFSICENENTCTCFDVDVTLGIQMKTHPIQQDSLYWGLPLWKRVIKF